MKARQLLNNYLTLAFTLVIQTSVRFIVAAITGKIHWKIRKRQHRENQLIKVDRHRDYSRLSVKPNERFICFVNLFSLFLVAARPIDRSVFVRNSGRTGSRRGSSGPKCKKYHRPSLARVQDHSRSLAYCRGPFLTSASRRSTCAFSRVARLCVDGPFHQCLFMWSDKWSLRENDRWQRWHLNGFWPVCLR